MLNDLPPSGSQPNSQNLFEDPLRHNMASSAKIFCILFKFFVTNTVSFEIYIPTLSSQLPNLKVALLHQINYLGIILLWMYVAQEEFIIFPNNE